MVCDEVGLDGRKYRCFNRHERIPPNLETTTLHPAAKSDSFHDPVDLRATIGRRAGSIRLGVAQCDREMSRSSNFFPLRSCARTQCGCKPRPDQVSPGRSGFRYFGCTFG